MIDSLSTSREGENNSVVVALSVIVSIRVHYEKIHMPPSSHSHKFSAKIEIRPCDVRLVWRTSRITSILG